MSPGRGWIDLSRPAAPGVPVWPGDTPWSLAWGWSMAEGASVNVGRLGGSTHTGSHADAPLHVDPDGAPVDALDPAAFLGPADVLDLAGEPGAPIGADELEAAAPPDAERLLLATGCDWSGGFPERFRALSPDAAAWCAERGLRLLGTDAPSVDPFDSKTLDAHHALIGGGVAILESLDLAAADSGRYELVALPLLLTGADASPVRAVARRIAPTDD